MDTFWTVVACIVLVPLLYLGSPYIAVFLTMIPIRIIGFFCKIADFFKDEPTLQNSTHNPPKKQEHKESHEEQANKSISSKPSLSPLQTSRSSPVVSTQNPKPSQPVAQVKSAPPAPQPSKLEQAMKSQLVEEAKTKIRQKEEHQKSKKVNMVIPILGICCFVLVIVIVLLAAFLYNSVNKPSYTHGHDYDYYTYGKCSGCGETNTEYDFSKFQEYYDELLTIMSSMENPVDDLNSINDLLNKLPSDYQDVRRIKAQYSFFKYRFDLFVEEFEKNNSNHLKIQDAFFEILDKETNEAYKDWNIHNAVFSLLKNKDYFVLTWSILQGKWTNNDGYYFWCENNPLDSFLDTNLPTHLPLLHDGYYSTWGHIIRSTDESDNDTIRNEFQIINISSTHLELYSFKSNNTYVLYLESSDSNYNSSSDSSSSSEYNPSYSTSYIGNTQTKIFHFSSCSYLPDTINRITFTSRQQAVIKGYTPCGHCNP